MSADGFIVWCDPEPDPPPARSRLPNRRECFTETIEIGGREYSASVGFDAESAPKEIFLSGAKSGSDMDYHLEEAAIIASRALQRGLRANDLTGDTTAVSPVGAALALVARYETEEWR
jgi:hypothetical protein